MRDDKHIAETHKGTTEASRDVAAVRPMSTKRNEQKLMAIRKFGKADRVR